MPQHSSLAMVAFQSRLSWFPPKTPDASYLPRKLAAEDEVNAAAGAVVEGVGKKRFEQDDAVGFKMGRPVAAGFHQAAAGDGVLPRIADLLGVELAVVERQRPERPVVAEIQIVAETADRMVEAVVQIAVIEAAAPGDVVERRAGTPQAVLIITRFARQGPRAAADHGVEADVVVEGLLRFGAVAVLPLDAAS